MTKLFITEEQLQGFIHGPYTTFSLFKEYTGKSITERDVLNQYLKFNYPHIKEWPKYKFAIVHDRYKNNFELIFEPFNNLEDEVLFRLQI